MSKHSIPIHPDRGSIPLRRNSESAIATTDLYQAGYQQALADFAISDLLNCLKTCSDANFDAAWVALTQQEAEALAAILIQTLTANLDGRLLSAYLDAMRCDRLELSSPVSKLRLSLPSTDLPANFPEVETPRFLYGDRLRWISRSETADWGRAIGRFYSFATYCGRWRWCYLIWLDPDSPSAAWVRADIAWEDDLEPMEEEEAR